MSRADEFLTCHIVVRGELGPRFTDSFDSLVVGRQNGTSTLRGRVRDQAELGGILALLAAFGIPILSISTSAASAASLPAAEQPR